MTLERDYKRAKSEIDALREDFKHSGPQHIEYALDQLWRRLKNTTEALEDVLERIENSENWWMDEPDRGGFDVEMIKKALEK